MGDSNGPSFDSNNYFIGVCIIVLGVVGLCFLGLQACPSPLLHGKTYEQLSVEHFDYQVKQQTGFADPSSDVMSGTVVKIAPIVDEKGEAFSWRVLVRIGETDKWQDSFVAISNTEVAVGDALTARRVAAYGWRYTHSASDNVFIVTKPK